MSSRRLEILRAIVDEYVATQEPVGSKSIADRHGLGISPATIRNEMAVLEDEGLITHPHTSAGRIPTDLGYRVFVDKLATVKPLLDIELLQPAWLYRLTIARFASLHHQDLARLPEMFQWHGALPKTMV